MLGERSALKQVGGEYLLETRSLARVFTSGGGHSALFLECNFTMTIELEELWDLTGYLEGADAQSFEE